MSTHTLEMGIMSTHSGNECVVYRKMGDFARCDYSMEKANLLLSPTLVELHCGNGYVVYTHTLGMGI